MKRILSYALRNRVQFVLAPTFKMLEAIFELLVPIVVSNIVEYGIKESNISYITKMTVILVILAVVGFLCALIAQYFSANVASDTAADIRRDMYKHIQTLSMQDRAKLGASTIQTRLTTDINQVETALNFMLRQFLRSPVIVIGAMIMAFTINAKVAIIFVITIPVLALIVFAIMKKTAPKYKLAQEKLDKDALIVKENLSGVRVIRAFNSQRDEIKRFMRANVALTNIQKVAGKISALMNPLTYAVINIAIIALLWIGSHQVSEGKLLQGNVLALYNYLSQILVELVKIANLVVMVSKAIASNKRIDEVFESKASIVDPTKASSEYKITDTKLTFDELSYIYSDSSGEAISDITFSVNAGETIGIIGGTGSGKSTLVNMIPRLLDASSGRLLVDGINIKDYKLEDLRNKIALVPQKSILFKGTIRHNLLLANKTASDEEIWKALEDAQAAEFVRSKAGGLDYMIERGGVNLSGGQKQRLSIARALLKNAEILILDDSSSALDYATDAQLRKAILKLDKNLTTFIVSQRAASVMQADKIVVLDNGRISGIGSHKELEKNNDIYAEICKTQFKDRR